MLNSNKKLISLFWLNFRITRLSKVCLKFIESKIIYLHLHKFTNIRFFGDRDPLKNKEIQQKS